MPLQDTDVLLVNRGNKSASATVKQIRKFIQGGLSSDTWGFTWVDMPPSSKNEISSSPAGGDANGKWTLAGLNGLQFNGGDNADKFKVDDYIIVINIAKGNGGTYRVSSINDGADFIGVDHKASSSGGDIAIGDEIIVVNLGSSFASGGGGDAFEIKIQESTPSGETGDLWYKTSTNTLSIYVNGGWVQINKEGDAYNNGEFYINAVNDLSIDNTGDTDVSLKVSDALKEMFNSGARHGTIYFPAGVYRLDSPVNLTKVGSTSRAQWTIKGDGTATKFYVNNTSGGISIETRGKDNYITIQDLMICPKQQVNGTALYLQNGAISDGNLPSGGSNQQFGCQIINVAVLSDDNKPNDQQGFEDCSFFKNAIACINYGRPRLSRVVCWNFAERSYYSFDNPDGHDYGYGFSPGQGTILNLTNCYSPWIDTCYFNGIANYGIYWNSDRGNTEGGTFTKIVINGAATGFYVAQEDASGNQGRHPHVSLLDSHVNATLKGVYMNNVKYFAVEHVLFYARSDRPRDRTHIDIELENCFSGTLKNSYSGGQYAAAITDRSLIPQNLDFKNLSSGDPGYNDQTTYTPHRVHVVLKGVDNTGGQGGVLKNRNILVSDYQLNAYTAQVNPADNSTRNQKNQDGNYNGQNDVDWQACYEVRGEAADVTIEIPPYPNDESETGTFDSSQYPPEDKMVYVNKGRVKVLFNKYKEVLYDDNEGGYKAIQHQKIRMAPDGKTLAAPQPIYTDAYFAQDSNGEVVPYGAYRIETIDNTANNHASQVMIQNAYEGEAKIAAYFRDGGVRFPYQGNSELISFNVPGSSYYPGIYFLEDGDPSGRLPNAGLGSLCLKRNDKMFFKTSTGWREVMLK